MKQATRRLGLGVDAGGTYTDAVLYDFSQNQILDKNKSLTTKLNFSIGINKALAGIDQEVLAQVDLISVSTTLATNALVEGEGQKTTLLLFGEEFSDVLPGQSNKKFLSGRLNINGKESEPIDEQEIRNLALQLVEEEGVCAFAVSGFAATVNPAHELRAKEIIAEATGKFVCCGHEFSNQVFADFRSDQLENSMIYHHIVQTLVSNYPTRYALKVAFNHPIIGIGGPTPHFLPTAGNKLHARVIIPPNADVANAVGAVTSHILIPQELKIRPESSGFYTVQGVAGTRTFPELVEAQTWVENWLKKAIREKAKESGNHHSAIDIITNYQCAQLNDGASLFLERTVSATLKCSPEVITPHPVFDQRHGRLGGEHDIAVSSGK